MSFIDRFVVRTKNLITREVVLVSQSGGFLLSITEFGHKRSRLLSQEGVEDLQEMLWNKSSVSNGIVMKFAPDPSEFSNKFEIPSWAMERLRDDMMNERVHLTVVK